MDAREPRRDIKPRPWQRGKTPCAYCGAAAATDGDHVVPDNLYTVEARKAVSGLTNLLTVPACHPCNEAKGRYDEPLRNYVLPNVDVSGHPEATQLLVGKLVKAVATNRVRLLDRFYEGRYVPVVSPSGLMLQPNYEVPIDDEPVRAGLAYIARGLHYLVYGERLEPAAAAANVVDREQRQDVTARFFALGVDGVHEQGAAFTVVWNGQAPTTVYWLLAFYDQLLCLGRTAKPNAPAVTA